MEATIRECHNDSNDEGENDQWIDGSMNDTIWTNGVNIKVKNCHVTYISVEIVEIILKFCDLKTLVNFSSVNKFLRNRIEEDGTEIIPYVHVSPPMSPPSGNPNPSKTKKTKEKRVHQYGRCDKCEKILRDSKSKESGDNDSMEWKEHGNEGVCNNDNLWVDILTNELTHEKFHVNTFKYLPIKQKCRIAYLRGQKKKCPHCARDQQTSFNTMYCYDCERKFYVNLSFILQNFNLRKSDIMGNLATFDIHGRHVYYLHEVECFSTYRNHQKLKNRREKQAQKKLNEMSELYMKWCRELTKVCQKRGISEEDMKKICIQMYDPKESLEYNSITQYVRSAIETYTKHSADKELKKQKNLIANIQQIEQTIDSWIQKFSFPTEKSLSKESVEGDSVDDKMKENISLILSENCLPISKNWFIGKFKEKTRESQYRFHDKRLLEKLKEIVSREMEVQKLVVRCGRKYLYDSLKVRNYVILGKDVDGIYQATTRYINNVPFIPKDDKLGMYDDEDLMQQILTSFLENTQNLRELFNDLKKISFSLVACAFREYQIIDLDTYQKLFPQTANQLESIDDDEEEDETFEPPTKKKKK